MANSRNKNRAEPIELPIFDPAFKSDPHPFYDCVRKENKGVALVRLPSGLEAWLVLDGDLARRLLNEPTISKELFRHEKSVPDAKMDGSAATHFLFRHMLTLDPPEHTRLRGIIAQEFSPRQIGRLGPKIAAIVDELLNEMEGAAEVDLLASFARPLPLRIICELLGAARSDEARIEDWSARLLLADLEDSADLNAVAEEYHQFLVHLADRKRVQPDESIYAGLVVACDQGALTQKELSAMGFLLLAAGHETTMNLIGNGMIVLLSNPQRWRALCDGTYRIAEIVEELLRFCSPLEVATARIATMDITIADLTIRSGDLVFVGLAAANRDSALFQEPHRFCPARRDAASHLAFGHGTHYCVGAALARLEAEMAFGGLARHFPGMELILLPEELEWIPGLITRGVRRLPVRLRSQAPRKSSPPKTSTI